MTVPERADPPPPFAGLAELLLCRTLESPPTLGPARLICVDGRAGSGKTTLGQALAAAAAGRGTVRLVHMDDIYEGWSGLESAVPRVAADLVRPLAAGRPGRYRRYDWAEERLAEWHTVQPVDLLVLEGVGSGARAYAEQITTLVWVEAPRELRLARGIARDGEHMLPHWRTWMADEDALFARERTRDRADVVVDASAAGGLAWSSARDDPSHGQRA